MATHSSLLAWRIPWTEEVGRLQSMGLQRDRPKRLTLSLCSERLPRDESTWNMWIGSIWRHLPQNTCMNKIVKCESGDSEDRPKQINHSGRESAG